MKDDGVMIRVQLVLDEVADKDVESQNKTRLGCPDHGRWIVIVGPIRVHRFSLSPNKP